jgi:hypothetical protein
MASTRRLTAILAADVAGYSRYTLYGDMSSRVMDV